MDLNAIPTWEQVGTDAAKGTPERIGQTYFATDALIGYIATGIASAADWKTAYLLTGTVGHMLVGTASGWVVLAVGADGYVLQADSGEAEGVKWVSLSASIGKKSAKVSGYPSSVITAATALSWNVEDYDNDAIANLGTNNTRLTIKTAGNYLVVANGKWQITSGGINWYLRKNGATQLTGQKNRTSLMDWLEWNIVESFAFAVNDYIEIYIPSVTGSGGSRSANQIEWSFSVQEI